MRRDVYIENDSGGFSVVAADAVDAIIADGRNDDFVFVKDHKALLLELYGDDSLPVRIVVDEPLRADEEAQWLARATWQIDTSDGKMLVMGGFDPDVLSEWKDAARDTHADGRGVGAVSAMPGSWRVDIYAHAGSMNGRAILSETDEKPGTAFRRSHAGRAFPLWLAKMLEFSGEDDPGHEELWTDVKGSIEAGKLAVDTGGGDAIGFLVHFTRSTKPLDDPPEEVWFGRSDNSRVPATFPLGIASDVPDPDLRSFHDNLLGIKPPEPERPIATGFVGIIETWPGDPLKPVEGGAVALDVNEIFLLHWMAALTADSTPRFELWVEARGAWTPPKPTADFAVTTKSSSVTALGPVPESSGWHTWWIARDVAKALAPIPDGSTLDLAMLQRLEQLDAGKDAAVGRACYSGTMSGGKWQITEASPKVSRDTLDQALGFARDLAQHGRLRIRGADRKAFDSSARMNLFETNTLKWDGEMVSLEEPEERVMLMLAGPVFKARFGNQWPVDAEEPDVEA